MYSGHSGFGESPNSSSSIGWTKSMYSGHLGFGKSPSSFSSTGWTCFQFQNIAKLNAQVRSCSGPGIFGFPSAPSNVVGGECTSVAFCRSGGGIGAEEVRSSSGSAWKLQNRIKHLYMYIYIYRYIYILCYVSFYNAYKQAQYNVIYEVVYGSIWQPADSFSSHSTLTRFRFASAVTVLDRWWLG